MLNLFQHLVKSITYETLKQVQGDRNRLFQQPVNNIYMKMKKLLFISLTALLLFLFSMIPPVLQQMKIHVKIKE